MRLHPFGPLLSHELRIASRRKRTYWLRFLYLVVLLALLSTAYLSASVGYDASSVVSRVRVQQEVAMIFFYIFAFFSIIAMTLLGPILTAGSINAERISRTLDVLLATPISAQQVIVGKLASRLFTAIMLLALSLPLLAVVRLMGSIELSDMLGVLAISVAVVAAWAAVGLWLSCGKRGVVGVIIGAYVMMLVFYIALPVTLSQIDALNTLAGSFGSRFLLAVSPMYTLVNQLMQGAYGGGDAGNYYYTVVMHLLIAVAFSLLAMRAVTRLGQDRPIIDSTGAARTNERASRALPANTLLWREMKQRLSSRRGDWLLGIVLLLSCITCYFWAGRDLTDFQPAFTVAIQICLTLGACVASASAMSTEREADTLPVLLSTPMTGGQIMWAKFAGVLGRMRVLLIVAAIHLTLMAIGGQISVLAAMAEGVIFLAGIMPFIATGLWLGLRFNRPLPAIVINLLLPIIVWAGMPIVLSISDEFHFTRQAAESSGWLIPTVHAALATDFLSQNLNSNVYAMPPWRSISGTEYLGITMLIMGGYALIGLLGVTWLAWRFDKLTGRAWA